MGLGLTIAELMARHAAAGRVQWIGLRPARRAPMRTVTKVEIALFGLAGDHRGQPGKRAVTLIQAEHLEVIRALAERKHLGFGLLRRNIAVAGINLLALKGRVIGLGTARLRITGPCAPCSRMEEALGPGGYNAMRGHGGVTAEVVQSGQIALGDAVWPAAE